MSIADARLSIVYLLLVPLCHQCPQSSYVVQRHTQALRKARCDDLTTCLMSLMKDSIVTLPGVVLLTFWSLKNTFAL